MKTIVLTGGGTSGHVTPNIALIPRLINRGYDIYYIGSKNGIEKQLIEKEGIPYYGISAGKLRRYFDVKNFTDIFRIIGGFGQSVSILRKIKPDVVFSKGGFVSCPVVWAAWVLGIPVIIHESDITPGLTNKLSMPFSRKVCYTFPETEKHLIREKACYTGLPVRDEIFSGNRMRGYKLCGFMGGKPVLMVIGGSQGSENINRAVRSALDELLKNYQIAHICGRGNVKPELENIKGYKQFEYVDRELPDIFACADVLISRAGATVLFEILSLKKPALLIPLSKNASRGDQILNANSFKENGYSEVLYEEDMTAETLVAKVNEVYKNRERYVKAMQNRNLQNPADKIVEIIEEVAER
ncbi:UDP-N-acetylglucosamine--N-acetylmuramyl-(pentapeptide) pyrophosphoryl-undecaprenol N-acetylglucosamine transferase MurG [Thermoclostridium stercorarium subsp. stercorarium DSM 8532]|uniref:UDP-N-acetylglucosamine--N-acetylmuramyl-(pentapeptide) pyrophosphoryl-undecaprenol N-acetylglucosamine transferase n=2 Tax=Thermoclostridium stercorarium TaxID=1510 RepID=L7VM41_THES1|nr:undecaprenyldiphospho-muramoylpentapeptide beta-N-acetylglucosaminyltransferase [Thermoclostridium stercorarium]AGC67812.1 UDP-N-acetylglucosamine--N-acetylmuramyl-(pentapeptide) pyrophosphoryl-undecaprenol N-acetylglucosamine transferase MurG [Thermoclostridium stercorarium subsp. stercorarium DSM 8532]AGI38855.1 UDP-N-acetylglucosamine-N-acetylmuramyl-pentapeptide pyrophosphoryl-undecaprenol N-acetylglucosamine transferase [Thermoclostridium stercorarium subsp. stercorarium DSM 8532]ANW9821